MSNKDRRCSVCGKTYLYCPRCQEYENKPHWYFCFCSENCKTIYEVTSNFESGQIDGLIAKEELKKLDLSKSKNFGESYRNSIKKINSFKTIAKSKKEVVKNLEGIKSEKAENDNDKSNEEKVLNEPKEIGKQDVE